jgi:HK97 family phage major capsid protein
MNRKSLLTLLKANGYAEANPTIESVKSYLAKLASEGVELQDKEGNPLNIDTIWAAKSVLTLAGTDADTALSESQRKSIIADAKGKDSPHGDADTGDRTPRSFNIGNSAQAWERKNFNARAARGETHLADADTAEVMGAYFRRAALGREGYSEKANDEAIIRKAALSSDFAGGGFTVPDVLSTQIIDIKPQYSAIRSAYGGLTPIAPSGESVPRRTGGVTVYSPGEGVAATESNPTGDQVKLTPFEMVALSKPSRTMLQRSAINFGDWIAREMTYAIDKKFEEIVLLGDGTSTYFNQVGIIGRYSNLVTAIPTAVWTTNAEYAASIVRASGNAWSEITYDDMAKVIGRPLDIEDPMAMAIICSRPFYYSVLVPLASSKGGVTRTEVLNGVQRPIYEGFPVIFSNAMPQREANGSVCLHLAEWNRFSKVAEVPGSMNVEVSTERFWDERKVGYQISVQRALNIHDAGNASATAASRVPGPIASLITAES